MEIISTGLSTLGIAGVFILAGIYLIVKAEKLAPELPHHQPIN